MEKTIEHSASLALAGVAERAPRVLSVLWALTGRLGNLLLPLAGVASVVVFWAILSATLAPDLPSPLRTWHESERYLLDPFFKEGEMNQGMGRLLGYSLLRVGEGYLLAIVIGTPLGFLLGLSASFSRAFDPLVQILRPISPLAWLPLGLVIFQSSEPAALFTIATCAMWPTVINTAVGVRSINPEYLNVGRVLRLSRGKMLRKIIIPATIPYLFTGYRLSLGIAWLVIVAAEMLTGSPGVGGFLWQEYNSLVYSHILLAIVTIGVVGYLLDRLMSLAEARFRFA
jgi:nitrate/nitrite transport system permease protein